MAREPAPPLGLREAPCVEVHQKAQQRRSPAYSPHVRPLWFVCSPGGNDLSCDSGKNGCAVQLHHNPLVVAQIDCFLYYLAIAVSERRNKNAAAEPLGRKTHGNR